MNNNEVEAALQEYIAEADWDEPVQASVLSLIGYAASYCPEPLSDAFVSETINQEGGRDYQSAWFFSRSFALEFFDFLAAAEPVRFDITHMSGRVARAVVTSQAFHDDEGSPESRLAVEFATTHLVTGLLRASGGPNCRHLRKIAERYIIAWSAASFAEDPA